VLVSLGILGLMLWLARWLPRDEFPYERASALFTPAERAFLLALREAAGSRYAIFGKVRLADLVRPRAGLTGKSWAAAFGRISRKHVDFVLCEPHDGRVLAVVELDDRSHAGAGARARDRIKDGALRAAGVPLLRMPAQRAYHAGDLRLRLDELVRDALTSATLARD